MIPPPRDAIDAVTHVDPYPYYAELTRRRVHRDSVLDLWVAASAAEVSAILEDDRFVVRPPAEPVPRALLGSAAAEIFRRLVRMNEGGDHRPVKSVIAATMDSLPHDLVAAQSRASARKLTAELARDGRFRLGDLALRMPIHVVGSLLGLPLERLPEITQWIDRLVRGFGPGGNTERIREAGDAAEALLRFFRSIRGDAPYASLLATLSRNGDVGDVDTEVIVANAIGLLTQSYEATAGLIGNSVVALVRAAATRRRLAANPEHARDFVLEVLHRDPPIQNTRRWVARSATVAGNEMMPGECILLVLAAANHDAEADRTFSFGAARHSCPGEVVAVAIAEATLYQLLAGDRIPDRWEAGYQPSINARIPLSGTADMPDDTQVEKAHVFRWLHGTEGILLLPNATL